MDKRYITLFKEIAHSTQVLADKVKSSEYQAKTEDSDKVSCFSSAIP